MIPHSRPTLGREEISAAVHVLKSGHIAKGTVVDNLEKRFSSFLGTKASVALNSGTSSLHLCLLALGIGKGDKVIVPTYVCEALVNAVMYTGATPVLCDIDENDYCISHESIRNSIEPRVKAVVVPHMFGHAAKMDEITELASEKDIKVVEDCAHAVGGYYKKSRLGSIGDLSFFSFYATKMITSGQGGLVSGRDKGAVEAARDLAHYDQKEEFRLRFNYTMTDLQAAIALEQMKKLDSFISARKKIAGHYSKELANTQFVLPDLEYSRNSVFYRYVIQTNDADSLIKHMKSKGVMAERPVFAMLHKRMASGRFPVAEKIFREAVSIPLYPSLKLSEQRTVLKQLRLFN